ncbi:MAG TPA: thioredoxin [Candidatus Avoscillospira avistercoris]|uniref:Thioredoxin n=1 Tax=Candidatus Avoscillospira avistercoris TaxID=2840707 RepID=A0A9D1FBF2_9FIRM|nr:thioredoxin [Candidatus Avoscillospira avistercoris]
MAILHLNQQNFDHTIDHGVTLVDFWTTWCGPCKMVAPVLERLAGKYDGKAVIAKVDIDENPDLAQRFNIMSIPTVMVFRDGRILEQTVGAQPESVYAGLLNEALEG